MATFGEGPLTIVCPTCHQQLCQTERTTIRCSGCNIDWQIDQGVPSFITNDVYWGEPGITRDILRDVIARMDQSSWHELLGKHSVPEVQKTYHFISDLERARWHSLANLTPDSVALDLGAGMGAITHALSRSYKHIYAVEQVRERVQFTRKRLQQDGINNVSVIHSDVDHLPFSPSSFDLIVLNGVLEWLPFSKPSMNPRSAQLYYLEELRRLLKPGGAIYVGIENRYYYAQFLGGRDPHINLRFVTILPRLLAHLYCRLKIGDSYRPYLYSTAGYRSLLGEAGYANINIYSALPSYNDPKHLISMNIHSRAFVGLFWNSKRSISCLLKHILVRLNLLKHMGYAYAIFAYNEPSNKPSI